MKIKTLIKVCIFQIIFIASGKSQTVINSHNIDFYHLKTDDGIAQNSITDITQDTIGQIWFATKNGVIRYNSKKLFIYKNIPDKPNSIINNFVNNVYTTSKGELWIATQNGANVYDYKNDCFITPKNSKLTNIKINSVAEDKQGILWFLNYTDHSIISFNEKHNIVKEYSAPYKITRFIINKKDHIFITTDKNIFLEFDLQSKSFKKHLLISEDEFNSYPEIKSFASNLTEDSEGNIWFGTNFGFLIRFNPETGKLKQFHFKDNFYPRNHLYIMFLKEDKEYNLWFGTWFDGLYKLSKNRKIFSRYLPEKENENSLSNNILNCTYQDNAGYLWFGTEFAGINILKKNKKFYTIANNSDNPNLPALPYLCVAVETTGKVWLGTDMGGLLWFKKKSPNNIHKFNFGKENAERIFSILIDSKKFLWAGTELGLYKINTNDFSYIYYPYKKENYNALGGKNIISLCEDKHGNIWAGSIYKGLTKINVAKNKFYHFEYEKDNPNGISNNYISVIFCDTKGTIWAGTLDGLCKFDNKTGNFTVFKNNPKNHNSISSDKINCIFEKNNNLWIGTEGGGLNKYDYKTRKFIRFMKKDGLPSDNIKGINCDNHNNLWISTTHNLSKFNLETEQFTNYGKSDGLYNTMYI
ncbi:MAG: hypothetical protein J7K64_00025, partial [Bacteroidales bacterium]|nr:hypothetical protein [Bacteroidales bacterium]